MSSSDEDSPLKKQLMSKIADQANELAKINVELVESRAVMDKIENRNIALTHDTTSGLSRDTQRKRIEKEYRDKFIALEKQLLLSNSRLNENSKARNQQVTEMEKITREYKFFKSQTIDLQKDNQNLKTQLHTKDKMIKKLKSNAYDDPEPIRQELDKANIDLNHLFTENEELKLKIRVLEDALEFRADEIGLAGHADLLSKIAHFRGEVNALKNDLQSKHVKLETVMNETTAEREKNEQLNESVSAMQVRLMEAKRDMSRIQESKNLLDQLKDTETERDVLVDFIQSDMKKSVSINDKLDITESNLQHEQNVRLSTEQKLNLLKNEIQEKDKKLTSLLENVQTLTLQVNEGKEQKHKLEMKLDETKISLDRKSLEADELFKMQTSLLNQTKDKDSNCDSLERSVREEAAKSHDLELQITYLKKDNDMFVEKNSLLQEQVFSLTEQIKDIEPRLMRLEPEYTRLTEEKSMWTSQKEDNTKDLQGYKVICATLEELNNSLQSLPTINTHDERSEQKNKNNSSGSTSGGCGSGDTKWKSYSLSQQHVMWCGIPALRRLSPPLYDQIRVLFQDLRQMEKDLNDCHDTYEVDIDDLKVKLKKKTNELEQNSLFINQSKSQLEKLTHRLQECEVELNEKREVCAILDNIRIVLKSSAASTVVTTSRGNLHKQVNHSTLTNSAGGGGSGSVSGAINSRFDHHNHNLDVFEDGLQQPIDDLNLQDLSEQFIIQETTSSSTSTNTVNNMNQSHSHHKEMDAEIEVENRDLPAVLSQALIKNLDSVLKVSACEEELVHLRTLTSNLQRERSILLAENDGLKEASRSFKELSQSRESEHSSTEKHSQHSLNQAAELTERQNTLISKLEDKLTEFRRKMLLKASQVTSLQQRESALQKRLYQTITSYAHMTSTKVAISVESALPELVKVVSSLLQDAIANIQDAEYEYSSMKNNKESSIENEQPIIYNNNSNLNNNINSDYHYGHQHNFDNNHTYKHSHGQAHNSSSVHVPARDRDRDRDMELREPPSPALLSPGGGNGSSSRRRAPPQPPVGH